MNNAEETREQKFAKACPFVGLGVIDDKDLLFERENEIAHLTGLMQIRDCSVVYGRSGVGKSSILSAGLSPALKEIKGYPGKPTVSICRKWSKNPIADLYGQLLEDTDSMESSSSEHGSLDDLETLLGKLAEKGPIYLILDQFEELFNIGDETDGNTDLRTVFLGEQLIRIIDDERLRTNVLLSLRSDSIDDLRILQRHIPDLLNEPFSVEPVAATHLESLLNRTIAYANEHPENKHALKKVLGIEASIEDLLLEELLKSSPEGVRSPWNPLRHTGFGFQEDKFQEDKQKQGYIDLPYLQLAMQRLWDKAARQTPYPQKVRLSKGVLKKLHGMPGIMESYVQDCLGDDSPLKKHEPVKQLSVKQCIQRWRQHRREYTPRQENRVTKWLAKAELRTHSEKEKKEKFSGKEQDLVAHLFEYMVTESGHKLAQTLGHLEQLCKGTSSTCGPCLNKIGKKGESDGKARIREVLEPLAVEGDPTHRLLRKIPATSEKGEGKAYTLYHDRLAEPVWNWSKGRLEDIRRCELKRKQLIGGGVGALFGIIVGLATGFYIENKHLQEEQRQTIAKLLISDSRVEEKAGSARIALATEALLRNPDNSEATDALRNALAATWPNASSDETGAWPTEAKNTIDISTLTSETCPAFVSPKIGDKTGEIQSWLAPIQPDKPDRRVRVQQTIAPVSRDTILTVVDCHSGRMLMKESIEHGVVDVDFAPEGERLAILTADNKIRAWRLDPFRLDFTHSHPTPVERIGFGEEGRLFRLIDHQEKTENWLVDNRGGVYTLPTPNASSPLPSDEKTVYAQNAELWSSDLADGGARRSLGPVPDGEVNDIRFSPDGQAIYLDTGYPGTESDGTEPVSMYDSRLYYHDKLVVSYTGKVSTEREPTVFAFHPARDSFAMARRDGSVALCDYSKRDAKPSCSIRYTGKPDTNVQQVQWRALAFAGEAVLLGAASSGQLRVWDLDREDYQDVAVADNVEIEAIRAGLANERVALMTTDGKTRLWALRDGVLRHERDLDGIIAFSKDGQAMARLTEDKTVWLEWLARGVGSALEFPIEKMSEAGVGDPQDVALSPDGAYLAVLGAGISGSGKRIALYSTEHREVVTSFLALPFAKTLEFASRRYLNVADSIGESHLMLWKPEDLIALARERYLDEEMKPGKGVCLAISNYLPESEEPKLCPSAPSPGRPTPPLPSP
uniref:WD40 repeat n=1 Tax=Candidatus Kentrum sp. LPFa TaxID=2126335 RepID=A0A450XXJ6_9GAMM|nr:MAG: WD40 repeat [Candidatus Kentron sp. LPFa]VFK33975.1 MAG: WD40 repeat [Candidatus Kentron sp. LPFa]